jgi:hypothetical protein
MIKFPIAALVVVVALLGGFYGGYKVGGSGQASAAAATGTNGTGAGAAFGRGAGAGAAAACPSPGATPAPSASGRGIARRGTSGTVTNLTSKSLTVHDARCNTDVKVSFDPSVIIRKSALGQVSDLQENDTVTVVGTREADGTVKANSIQIVPAGTGAGGFGGANGG